MSKHTPGPWAYSADFSDYDSIHTDFRLDAGDMEIIGGCGCCGSPTISSEADARLIAAAPEILKALEYAVEIYGRFGAVVNEPHNPGEWIEQARAAIAKAKGGEQHHA